MAGYIGSKSGTLLTNTAERKQTYSITTATTSLTGLAYTPTKVHVFHNGVRLVDGTDYTATNGTSITLTNAAQNGDEVVVISYPSFQTSDTVSAANGGTFAGNVEHTGTLTASSDLNAGTIKDATGTNTALTINSDGFAFPKKPVLEVGISSTQTITSGTWTKVAFDSIDHDNASWFDNTTYRYTPQKAGYYQVNLNLYFSDGSNTLLRAIGAIGTSGTNYSNQRLWDIDWTLSGATGTTEPQTRSGSRMFYLNGSTDFIEAWAFINLNTGSPQIYATGEMSRITAFFVST